VKLLDSLLDAIVRLEGDSLVMHVGEKPYVVTASSSMNAYRGPLAWGQVELSSRVLTFDAVSSMLGQILPADQQQALTEFGAIEHEIPSPVGVADRFTVVAARGGEDVWVELRRRPIEVAAAAAEAVASEVAAPAAVAPEAAAPQAATQAAEPPVDQAGIPQTPVATEPVADAAPIPEVAASAPAAVEEPAQHAAQPPLAATETHEPAAEIQLLTIEVVPESAEQPAAQVELDGNSSIVVAIPGQDAEEISLNAVPENAIQIVDDEPQDVPTEEEVDAMLAATAGAILTSGMGEVVDDGATAEDGAVAEADSSEEVDDENEIVLNIDMPYSAPAIGLSAVVPEEAPAEIAVSNEPAFELSPPPLEMNVETVESEPEAVAEPPAGTPLFSEEAILAAAVAEPVASDAFDAPRGPQLEPHELEPHELMAAPSVEPFVPVEPQVVAQEPVAQDEPTATLEQPLVAWAPIPELQGAGEDAYSQPFVDTPPHQPEPTVWQPEPQQDAWVPQLPAHFEPPTFEAAVDDEPIGHADSPRQVESSAQFAPPVQFETPSADVWSPPVPPMSAEPQQMQPVAPMDQPPALDAQPPADIPAFTEPVVTFDAVAGHEDGQEEVVMFAEPAASMPPPEEPWAPLPSMEAGPPIVDQPFFVPLEVNADANTLSQSAEAAVSEPMPQIEAPVPEMTMEVTPELRQQEAPVTETTGQAAEVPAHAAPEPAYAEASMRADDELRQAVVVPLARTPIKTEVVTVPFTPSEDAALMHTLRIAAARGASTVYVVAQSKPMIRIDGEIGPIESEPTLTAADVDRLVMELAPPRRRDALQNGPVEWLCDVPEIGRVRCLTFRDHRGPGVLFRMFPPRAISADQLGLTPEVQALCQQSDGLVLVTGARASGKSTLLNSFVDVINRTRSDHLITVESQIGFVHESRRSFISQRETRGDAELAATYARAALREDPDVIMIEDLKSADLVSAALEAAESGRLVLASVPAASTIGALERLIELFPADRRAKARSTLATALRGVIAQVLLRRVKGGRVAAREILLNTPAVSQIVLEGKMFQLPVALDSGRRHGMVPLTDSLAAHVRDGSVNVAEAYRKALDRAALVALLKREGVDTSFAERLA
jgi:twitching motility protein PilT